MFVKWRCQALSIATQADSEVIAWRGSDSVALMISKSGGVPRPPDTDAATAIIGRRLCDIRSERRLRVSELARRAGVSASLISQIERGTSKPSVGTLFALAQVLEVPIDSFFSDASGTDEDTSAPAAPGPRESEDRGPEQTHSLGSARVSPWPVGHQVEREVVRFSDRARLEIRGGVCWERLTPTPIDGLEFLELIYAPGAESDSQAYRHPGIELVLVTSGEMAIYLGFVRHHLEPGDSIAFASSTPHRYVNETDSETRAVTVIVRDDLSSLPFRIQAAEEIRLGDEQTNQHSADQV